MADHQVNLSLSYRPTPGAADTLQVLASIIQPITSANTREPLDICCVIDVSGSMGSSASAQGVEDAGLTVLDIVKHAVRTVFSCLNENDRLSLVSYSNTAFVELALTCMDQAGKNLASQVLDQLRPTGSTNIWDGLLTGMGTFAQKLGPRSRNSALFLLTDGAPNILPPKGHVPSMKDYKDSNGGVYPATISTFGFGYSLQSELLNEISLEGGGSYSFIPDSGFVGTIFVNALANQLNSFAKHAAISLDLVNGAQLIQESLDPTCSVVAMTSWGAKLSIGDLPFNQRRDFIFFINISNWNRNGSFLEATLEYEPFTSDEKVTVTCQTEENSIRSTIETEILSLEANLFRHSMIERMTIRTATANENSEQAPKEKWGSKILKKFIDKDETITFKTPFREVGQRDQLADALAAEMKTWCDTLDSASLLPSESKPLLDYVHGLHLDLTGEINLAFQDQGNYQKWGRHYLPSIRRAHQLQQCNNFKDPGVQFYGGPLFTSLRDQAEDIFCTLPAPTPSAPQRRYGNAPTSSAPTPLYDMSAYMNASAGCVSGDSNIKLSDGTMKLMKDIRKGDVVQCNRSVNNPDQLGYMATVECLVATRCSQPTEMRRYQNDLLITPWHPIYLLLGSTGEMKWSFPFDTDSKVEIIADEFVYNLVLGPVQCKQGNKAPIDRRGQSYIANEIECISLAHGIFEDSVAQHEFYGTEAVVRSLQSLVGAGKYSELGFVSMDSSQVVRDPLSGLVCRYDVVDGH
jgi:Mg-chelatase subunit ChlD